MPEPERIDRRRARSAIAAAMIPGLLAVAAALAVQP